MISGLNILFWPPHADTRLYPQAGESPEETMNRPVFLMF